MSRKNVSTYPGEKVCLSSFVVKLKVTNSKLYFKNKYNEKQVKTETLKTTFLKETIKIGKCSGLKLLAPNDK